MGNVVELKCKAMPVIEEFLSRYPPEERNSWIKLFEWEISLGVMELAKDRAANGEWPCPIELGDFLMWIEDEIDLQINQFTLIPGSDDVNVVFEYARALQECAFELRALGVRPSPPPWRGKTTFIKIV